MQMYFIFGSLPFVVVILAAWQPGNSSCKCTSSLVTYLSFWSYWQPGNSSCKCNSPLVTYLLFLLYICSLETPVVNVLHLWFPTFGCGHIGSQLTPVVNVLHLLLPTFCSDHIGSLETQANRVLRQRLNSKAEFYHQSV